MVSNGSVWENAPQTYEILFLHRNIVTGLAEKEKCNLLLSPLIHDSSFSYNFASAEVQLYLHGEKNRITQSEMLASISHSQPFP